MKINIGKKDICYTCRQGKQTDCSAAYDDVFFDDTGNIADCKCYALKEKTEKAKKFVKPTVEEIAQYAKENGYTHVDAQAFYNHYETVNWHVGKVRMSKWKAAVASWENRQKKWDAERQQKENKGKLQSAPSYDMNNIKRRAADNTEL